MSTPRMPVGLIKNGAGQRLWKDITTQYELSTSEYKSLELACFTADRIGRIRKAMGNNLIVKGSKGQNTAHPLLVQLRMDETHLTDLLKQIDLPQEGKQQENRSSQMRAVANSRWQEAFGES